MAATHFSSEIQSKRIDKGRGYAELQLLSQLPPSFKVTHTESPFGMTLRVEITKDLLPGLEIDSVSFDVLLEGSYPFQAPKVLCNTSFIRPSLADGRDLLRDIIDAQWSPSLTMNQMIPQLPAFVVATHTDQSLAVQSQPAQRPRHFAPGASNAPIHLGGSRACEIFRVSRSGH